MATTNGPLLATFTSSIHNELGIDGPISTGLCGTSDFEIGWGYMKQIEIIGMTAYVGE